MNRIRGIATAGVLVWLGILVQGCGGVSGSHSVSPASLFLPGLMKNEVPARPAPATDADSDAVRETELPGVRGPGTGAATSMVQPA